MHKHTFIFQPGEWLGEGDVEVSMPTEALKFYAHWRVQGIEEGMIHVSQDVEMAGFTEPMRNNFLFSEVTESGFSISLDNPMFGVVTGKGLVNEKTISWEIAGDLIEMEGFEIYEQVSEDEYSMRAEYLSQDQLRTTIKGRIWKKKG